MSVFISPVGLAAAPVANSVSFLATFKEKLCRTVCSTSTNQPQATVALAYERPKFNGTTVFVPVVATITLVSPSCGCNATTQVINERFMVAFPDQTGLPTNVSITSDGIEQGLIKIVCGKSNCYAINQAITVTITPFAAAAA